MPALPTSGTGCSFWPTPRAINTPELPETVDARTAKQKAAYAAGGPRWGGLESLYTAAERFARAWPTPSARDGDARRGATSPDSEAWSRKVERGAVNAAGMLSDDLKSSAVAWSRTATWSTPRVSYNVTSARAKDLYSSKDSLEDQAKAGKWRTPSSRDWKGTSAESWRGREDGDPTPTLADQVDDYQRRGPPDPKTPKDGGPTSKNGRVLNPQFVEALMGWPIGWSACGSSATALCPPKQLSHGESSTTDCAEATVPPELEVA